MITVEDHPLLDVACFRSSLPKPLGTLSSDQALLNLLKPDVPVPLSRPVLSSGAELNVDDVKGIVRDLLRQGGYKPTGRGKPASEYLLKAVPEGKLNAINLAVDVCNVVSFHSQLPISVVDFGMLKLPLKIGLAPANSEYVFNASGQTIKLDGLLCLFDQQGPCANGVKDSQRTKTSSDTIETITIIWGTNALAGYTQRIKDWYVSLLEARGVLTSDVAFE